MSRDLGSRNGTWVGGKRISVSKQESEDVEVWVYILPENPYYSKVIFWLHNTHKT